VAVAENEHALRHDYRHRTENRCESAWPLVTKPARLRSQGHWSFVVGAIGLTGCIVGVVQLLLYGQVSIRPGHDPVGGASAVRMLLALGLFGIIFVGIGALFVYRGRRVLHK
jgi:hypothetical protein